jgi:predicted lipase
MYAQEKETNFRWIYKFLSSCCPEPLPSSSLADVALEYELAAIGQFAELAHGSVSPTFVWANLETLLRPTYPLEGCTELGGSRLLKTFIGNVAKLQAYIAHRPEQRQIVVAFSGTSDLRQALHDLNALPKPFPYDRRQSKQHQIAKVHRGFWKMYTGLRTKALEGLGEALQQLGNEVGEVIITGHSLGGAMASFFLLDLLQLRDADCPSWWPPHELTLTLATFGSPRAGNMAFANFYQLAADAYRSRHGQDRLREYAVRAFNDGVSTQLPLYLS